MKLFILARNAERASFTSEEHNQRTNGPVNAHLISGLTISTKTSLAKFETLVK